MTSAFYFEKFPRRHTAGFDCTDLKTSNQTNVYHMTSARGASVIEKTSGWSIGRYEKWSARL